MDSSPEASLTQAIAKHQPSVLLLTKNNASQPFRFLDLPGELRNHIYELLVIRFDPDFNIFTPLRRIARVCTQVRRESLVIFLSRHNFFVKLAWENIDYLVHWLDTIGTLNLQYLKSLSIDCTVCMVKVIDEPLEYQGAFRRWHELVACLSAFNLRPSQLKWTWGSKYALAESEVGAFHAAENVYYFGKYTLELLL